jgi:hypothetical protein
MLLLLATPLFERTELGAPVTRVLFSLVAATGVAACARTRLWFWLSFFLVLPMLVVLWIAPVLWVRSVNAASLGMRFIFLMVICIAILARVVRDQVVTLETIAGAASAYLLFGVAWACLFGVVEHLSPGSFVVPAAWGPTADTILESIAPLIYFSFITLTTVGYGDILATSPVAANLAAAEAIMGQLYLAVLVARLVGLQIVQSDRSRHDDG